MMKNNLEDVIKSNAQKYYTDASQAMSDEVFDAIVDEVRKENPESDVLKTGWGYEVNKDNKIKHRYGHMGSLTKVRTSSEVINKLKLENGINNITISAKLDGMSVVLYYINGNLNLALTRGDGEYGINITNKVKYLIGDNIDDKSFTGAVRGEIMMTVEQFKDYQARHPEAKNHRNSAIGLINGDEITEDYKYLTLAVYSVVGIVDIENSSILSQKQMYYNSIWLINNFKHTAPIEFCQTPVSIAEFENKLSDLKDKWSKTLNIDGVVISKSRLAYKKETRELVQTAVAWKFSEEIKITKVKYIEWTMSKNDCYIPVVVFEPIELAGTTVKRATAFNAKFVNDNNIQEGTIIAVAKRGEIIPQIIEVVK